MIGDMSLDLAGTINREFINETARNLAYKPTSRTKKLEQVIEQIITYTGEIHPTQLNCLASISKKIPNFLSINQKEFKGSLKIERYLRINSMGMC